MQEPLTVGSPFSIGKSFDFAWRTLIQRFWFLLVIQFAISGVSIGIEFCMKSVPFHSIASTIIISAMMGGFFSILLKVVDGGKPRFSELFSKTRLWWRYLISNYCALALWAIGFAMFVVPGILVVIHTCFFALCITDDDLGPIAAFKRSSELTKGHRWKLLGFLIVLVILSTVVTCVGIVLYASYLRSNHIEGTFEIGSVMFFIVWLGAWAASLIFTELAWSHCYRQLTELRSLSSMGAKPEIQ